MIKKITALLCLSVFCFHSYSASAQTSNRMIVTTVVASNTGKDFNLDNDAYRDKLLKLFSYSSYRQTDLKKLDMSLGEAQTLDLMEGYSLSLTLKQDEGSKIIVRTMISKAQKTYIDTELSISKPGVFFMGGPTLTDGDLILILESGY